jgi:hypothetical protein
MSSYTSTPQDTLFSLSNVYVYFLDLARVSAIVWTSNGLPTVHFLSFRFADFFVGEKLVRSPSKRSSLTHTRKRTLTHLLTHYTSHSLTHSLTHYTSHSLTHSLTHLLTHSLTHSLTLPITHSLACYTSHSLTYYTNHSL